MNWETKNVFYLDVLLFQSDAQKILKVMSLFESNFISKVPKIQNPINATRLDVKYAIRLETKTFTSIADKETSTINNQLDCNSTNAIYLSMIKVCNMKYNRQTADKL